jgi:predicted type IV restriction endonuclease
MFDISITMYYNRYMSKTKKVYLAKVFMHNGITVEATFYSSKIAHLWILKMNPYLMFRHTWIAMEVQIG